MTNEELQELKELEELDLLQKRQPKSLGNTLVSKAKDIGSGVVDTAASVLPSKETLQDTGMGLAQ